MEINGANKQTADIFKGQLGKNEQVVVPFHYGRDGTILVPVRLGDTNVQFNLITGVPFCLVWTDSVPDHLPIIDLSPLNDYRVCRLPEVRIGKICLDSTLVKVSRYHSRDLDGSVGALGGRLLENFDLTIDYETKQLIFSEPGSQFKKLPMSKIVPLTFFCNAPRAAITLNGMVMNASIDTRTNFNHVCPNVLKLTRDKIDPDVNFARLKSLGIAGTIIPTPILQANDDIFQGVQTELGSAFLSKFRPTFDYRNKRLILESITATKTRPLQLLSEAFLHISDGHLDEAIKDFTQVIEADPELAIKAHCGRGLAFEKLKNYSKAVEEYQQAITAYPTSMHIRIGLMHQELRLFAKAIIDFGNAIDLTLEESRKARADRGQNEFEIKDRAALLADLYQSRAWNYANFNKLSLAIDDWSRALQLDSTDANAYADRAWSYEQLAQYERSISDLEQSIRLAPKNIGTLQRLNSLKKYQKSLIANPIKTASDAEYNELRRDPKFRFGESQLEAMIKDRPNMLQLVKKRDAVWNWAAQHFITAAGSKKIFWDKNLPDKPPEYNAETTLPYGDTPGYVRVRMIDNYGRYLSCEQLWSCLVFELGNASRYPQFTAVNNKWLKLSRSQYITENVQIEYETAKQTANFYRKIWLDSGHYTDTINGSMYWYSEVPASYSKFIAQYRNLKNYPWNFWGAYFDREIADKQHMMQKQPSL
ncbi:MAG: tetratricopeptide repeat protein [Candidatus Obscuribacterales bacterium]|nr:tetratricopeptide repeat protein [Candidatus Obscuribacterales bacterium]